LRIRIVLAVGAILSLSQSPAWAAKRVALAIGNFAYQYVKPLANPANDSNAITTTLASAGVDVVNSRRDLKANEMTRALPPTRRAMAMWCESITQVTASRSTLPPT
jgi:hypothetical protein